MKLRGFSSLKSMGTGNETSTEGDGYYPRRRGLISSLQVLGQFSSLLSPPASVAAAANAAAVKAAAFVSNLKKGTDGYNSVLQNEVSFKAVGNMRHLVVEACIARKLIDTSAYLWPGYVSASVVSVKDSVPLQESSWSTFMKGAELTGPLINALRATPASSLLELERLYHIALSGSEEEKSAAGKILCGASLVRGWNIQEHVVHLVVKLLSPPAPPDFSGPGSYLVSHMSILSAILFGLSSVDTVHILSLYGMVPEVAAALVPLCEAFGSILPTSHHQSTSDSEPFSYMIFSCAFLFLLRLWKFYRPPLEHCMSLRAGPACVELNLEYLLLLHNNRVALHSAIATDRNNKDMMPPNTSLAQPLYIESFPKLRSWYSQNQACIASTLSGVCSGNPVHQVANKILNMIYWKMTKGDNVSSSMSGSTESSCEEAYQRPVLPAWEVLEALPLVLEAVLAACAYGRLSSRDLITGLRDLIDYLPASLATIISYFSAEITRGIWKPVLMNGTDWPSPAAYLPSIESEMKEILASVGVDAPNCHAGGTAPVMLPLPMAVLVSLTITFKLDKRLEYIHAVAGSAMENCAMGCPWSSMPIIGALWAQKVRRWHDFIVVSCSRSPFRRDPEATSQLMRSCFTSFLGSPHASTSMLEASGRGVNGLLGRAISSGGVRLPIAPGFFYLRTCRTIPDTHYIDSVVLRLVSEWTHGLGSGWACGLSARLMQGRTSLASAVAGVKETATLGASLICIAGGIPLVQVLYEETMPTWLMSRRVYTDPGPGPTARILEGYAMAYLMILSGAFIWGLGGFAAMNLPVHLRRARVFHGHMEFMVAALEGSVSLGCDPATWKAYVSCFVGLLVGFMPAWIVEVKPETLKRLAAGLRGWHECDLALALLERGGQSVMASAVELIL
ncbi:Mediator of RNA polymerase II transcription subunit 33A [Acorus gramineus]|uniref:Mediator of RNA polymerase II transcription subunit 33A n=1 Tax=Acorus gramineus TaxID=55184 RepID=A0AAV9AL53_ACOGR|nr:Mediator of RNA polymerase II transcription subunit 33A [Acorus gramineus]